MIDSRSALLIVFSLFGLLLLLAYPLGRRLRSSRVWALGSGFALVGLLVALILTAISSGGNGPIRFVFPRAFLLWPTSLFSDIVALVGEPRWVTLLVLIASILSNAALYGIIGLVVGAGLNWTRFKNANSEGEDS